MSNCNTCNTCSQPVKVCCCPTPTPIPAVVPVVVCKSPIELLFEQTLNCYNDNVCVNPLTYITEQVLNYKVQVPGDDALVAFLGEGLVLSPCDICCPRCTFGNGSIYFLTTYETFAKIAEALPCKFSDTCCININANAETYIRISELIIDIQDSYPDAFKLNCCNNFTGYVEEFKNITDCSNALTAGGIVEYGSLTSDQESQLQNVTLMIQTLYPTATPTELCTILTDLLKSGLVIYCGVGGIFIGAVETFLKFAEANNINCK